MTASILYPPARFRPVRNRTRTAVDTTHGLIPHVQVGTGSLFYFFDDPASGASSHLWLSRIGGFEQYVTFGDRAWAQGAGNASWISCECEGFDDEDYTPIQITRLAELFRWGMQRFGWKAQIADSPDGYGLGTHRMGGPAWGGHSCPGDIRAGRRADILAQARRSPIPPSDTPERYAARPTLRTGSRGPDVIELQNALNIIFGHEEPNGDADRISPDGRYGPVTAGRVASLQRLVSPWSGSIADDGVCGPATWRKIGFVLTGLKRGV